MARFSFRIGIAALVGGLLTSATRDAAAVDDGDDVGLDGIIGGVTFYAVSYASLAGSVVTAIATGATLHRRPPPVAWRTFGYVFGSLSTFAGATWLAFGIENKLENEADRGRVMIPVGVAMIGSGASNFVLSGIGTSLDGVSRNRTSANETMAIRCAPEFDLEGRPSGVRIIAAW